MPEKSTRKRSEGGGRKAILRDRVQVATYMEREEAEALARLAPRGRRGVADLVRTILRDHLAREGVKVGVEPHV